MSQTSKLLVSRNMAKDLLKHICGTIDYDLQRSNVGESMLPV